MKKNKSKGMKKVKILWERWDGKELNILRFN